MPRPGGIYAAELLGEYVGPEDDPVEDIVLLTRIINHQGWASGAEARNQAAEWLARFSAKAIKIHNDAAEQRRFITFTFSPASSSHIQGSCYCLPVDGDQVRADKRKRANAVPMLEAVRQLSHRDFEFLCGLVLAKFGVDAPNVSQGSGDQGVDFYGHAGFGELISKTALPGSVEEPIKVWIIGQAKRYRETKVSTSDLRELVGAVELSRAKVHSAADDPLKNLKVRLCDPIFYMLVTSGEFTAGSRNLIERSGIIAMDGMQLCQFLADHGAGGGSSGFDLQAFLEEIDSIKSAVLFMPSGESDGAVAQA